MGFKTAKRERLKALIAMMGASGSGKTFSSLLLAKGMVQEMYPDLDMNSPEFWSKIGVVDTEHSRSKIYADMEKHGHYIGEFQHLDLAPPFTAEKYIQAMRLAKKAQIEVLIMDSTSHLWKQLLQEQSDLGGRYQDWRTVTPKYESFIEEFVYSDMHVIATMRAKQEYSLERNELDKLEVTKLGTKPVQRDDFEYEFLTAFMFDPSHRAIATKDNTPIFEELGRFTITPEHGKQMIQWLDKGIDVKKEQEKRRQEIIAYIYDAEDSDKRITDLVTEFESKAKKKLEEFPLALLERAYMLVENAVNAVE